MNSELETEQHPFGGCNKLMSQYNCIGTELLKYETSVRRYGYGSFSSFTHFREGVSFVPVEVLESYLEDLLDLDVGEDKLFIARRTQGIRWMLISALGLCAAIGVGLASASKGASLVSSFGLTICLALPFGILWQLAPRDGVARRMGFAQVVSHEVARRRGTDKGPREHISSTLLLGELLAHKSPGSARAATLRIIH